MSETYEFLSPEWMTAAKAIRDEMPHPDVPAAGLMRMNLIVTETPFAADVHGHIDTTDGEIIIEDGHLEGPDLTVTVDFATARAIFVNMDVSAAMQAFMGGRINVQGDITKLMTLQAPGAEPDPKALAIAEAVRGITRD
ncbi:MAG: SCP2 sterol-binding domain-containing protein [Acidobacteria bacterium]|nr:SCP2 sterol-binding domain-containing protein [Acidobacteriota bacterium]